MAFLWKYVKKYKKFIVLNFLMVIGFILIEIGIPTLLATGINNQFLGNDMTYILKLSLQMLAFAMIGLCALIVLAYSTNRLVADVVRDIRNDLFSKAQTLSRDDYDKFGVSRLITNTGTDAYTIMQFLIMLLRIGIMAPMMFMTSLFMIFLKSKSLALVTLIAIPLMVVIMIYIDSKTKPLSVRQQKSLDEVNLQIRESLTGLRVIRSFNNEDLKSSQFDVVSVKYADISKKLFQMVALVSPVFSIVFVIVISLVITIGSKQVDTGLLEYGTLVAFIEYVFHALFSFLMLATVLMMYPRAMVAVERIEEVMNQVPSIRNNENPIKDKDIKGNIEFKNVSFAYSDSCEKSVIKDISFKASPGETVAFIGSTGSGKSTLMKLIPRLIDVTEGSISLDGVDIRDYDVEFLRSKMGYVPQKSTLFSGSILDNIKFGNREASMEEIEKAVEISQAQEFVYSKEERYERHLSEGGTNLSGGQRQRLCIARALVRSVPIYIFDDSFSALDYKTDYILRKRLKEEITDATFFIVAQRVSTVKDADKILVLEDGQVVGMGTHRELLESCDVYYQIASSQLSEEELKR